MIVAQWTRRDGVEMEIHNIRGSYYTYEGERQVQGALTADEALGYMANVVHNVEQRKEP